jgi:sugar lactone lactonase YvrE
MKNVSLAVALSLVLFACSDSTDTPDGGDGGAPPGDGGACTGTGTGSINVVINGLPAGVDARVTFSGPDDMPVAATASTTLTEPVGNYTVKAEIVAKADPIVRTLYKPTVSTSSFCLGGAPQSVTVDYAAIASSNKLWTTNANNDSGQVLAYAGADLVATGSPAAKVATKGTAGANAGKALAFDKDGNMWAIGSTTADASVLRYAAADLGASGQKTPDRKIDVKLSGCSPSVNSLAFDSNGALWATLPCENKVLRLTPETISSSREYTPVDGDYATGATGPRHLAFDKDGNMWVSDDTTVRRFAPNARTADIILSPKAANSAVLAPDALAFDKDGNLWVTDFGGGSVYKLAPADLAGPTKDVVPSVIITIDVLALLESIAFDESGGLWLTYSQGKLARLAPEKLGASTSPGTPATPTTIITSADIGSAGYLAFFPAPAALPLYSSFR